MVLLKQVFKTYQSQAESVTALQGIDLAISEGEAVAVIGASGSGKSTLLNLLSGIDRPDRGELQINGQHLNDLSEGELASWRGKNIGIVFQFYQLFPSLSALDNVLLAMDVVDAIPKLKRLARAQKLLEEVGLEGKVKKLPSQLSGGEQQRVAIARALANDPPLILADEPTGNLDKKTGDQINKLFAQLVADGKTLIVVTHADVSGQAFDQLIEIRDGLIR